MTNTNKITVGELIDQLSVFNREDELFFGNDNQLSFYRTKKRGEKLVQIEFNEIIEKVENFK